MSAVNETRKKLGYLWKQMSTDERKQIADDYAKYAGIEDGDCPLILSNTHLQKLELENRWDRHCPSCYTWNKNKRRCAINDILLIIDGVSNSNKELNALLKIFQKHQYL